MLRMLYVFLFVTIFSILFAIIVVKRADNDWSVIPKPLRFVILPIYCFCSAYIGIIIFAWLKYIPDALSFGLSAFISIITFFFLDSSEVLHNIFDLVGDLILLPYLVMCVVFPSYLPEFKGEDKFTYNYRRVTLVIITCLLLIPFTFSPADGTAWYENAMFAITILLSAIFTYSMFSDDYVQSDASFLDKIIGAFKLFFSRRNPLLRLFRLTK